ncbi:MAG: sn-glycerol-3-phosphate ABC transporter ATP-binding protein UgpC [Lachnospiraceae bacterium]|nr:sn-glycerol-3-phosphate ABC transporter ATP-binding protein UgpC [Lachnospiraceae bacterium]
MGFIELKNVCKIYDKTNKNAVTDFNLSIEEKEFIAFVGPSGCGKSTTLRMIAGFEDISSGELYIDGTKMNEVAPMDRGISMVFQNYALYPHMTVEKNISYGLKNMKVPADEIQKKVDWAVDILGLQEYRYRKPKNLSGGQRQRVALGRAIVKNQKVFLMDEPLSNLDAKLRVSMRNEISKLHRQLGSTTIYVTHDQVEAMTMADRIVIMKDGVVQQVGEPMELYEHPANKFVAGFIGSPQMNFYPVEVKGKELVFEDNSKVTLLDSVADQLKAHKGKLLMGIRGEDIKLDAQNMDLYNKDKQKAVVDNTEVMGNENNLYFEFGGVTTVARVSKYEVSKIGDSIEFVLMPHKMHFFDAETEKAIELQYE